MTTDSPILYTTFAAAAFFFFWPPAALLSLPSSSSSPAATRRGAASHGPSSNPLRSAGQTDPRPWNSTCGLPQTCGSSGAPLLCINQGSVSVMCGVKPEQPHHALALHDTDGPRSHCHERAVLHQTKPLLLL
jgi:hypothetical protein